MRDEGLKTPVKAFSETFSGEQVVLDHLRAERPDLDWFVAPERTYSINDNPNTLRTYAGYVARVILTALGVAVVAAIWTTGGL